MVLVGHLGWASNRLSASWSVVTAGRFVVGSSGTPCDCRVGGRASGQRKTPSSTSSEYLPGPMRPTPRPTAMIAAEYW